VDRGSNGEGRAEGGEFAFGCSGFDADAERRLEFAERHGEAPIRTIVKENPALDLFTSLAWLEPGNAWDMF